MFLLERQSPLGLGGRGNRCGGALFLALLLARRRLAADAETALRDHVRIAAGIFDPAPLAFADDDRGRNAIKKIAIMADHQNRAGIIGDHLLQQIERFEIKVVGGLVEHQQVGGQRQGARQHETSALAARQTRHRRARLLGGEEEVLHVADDVFALAIDVDEIAAAAGQHILQALVRRERNALLVEAGHLHIGAQLQLAAVGLQSAREHGDERGLARAVLADNAHPVAAQDARGEIGDDGALPIGLEDMLGLDDQLARNRPLGDADLHIAHKLAGLAHLGAQFRKAAHAAHVALAPSADAVAHPMFFIGDLPVELVAVALLLLQHLIAPGLELAKALVEAPRRAPVDPDGGVGEVLQEASIMADDDEGRAERRQLLFQPFDGGQIKMVGGLVEQQHVRLGRQHPHDGRPARLATRQARRILIASEAQLLQQITGLVGLVAGPEPRLDVIHDCGEAAEIGLLGQVAHGGVGLEEAHALVRLGLGGGDAQKGRFARTVAADQRQPLAGRDGNLRPLQQGLAADGEFNAL